MKRISLAVWVLFLFLYGLKIYLSYIHFDFDYSFGYLDHQLYWQTLLDFLEGKALYKNIFWEYSLLPILIRIPFFLLFQKSFFATVVINLIILPIIGIILSFYIGKQLLGKKALYLYGVVLLFLGTNSNYSSIRYLVPELGLLLVIIGMEKNDKKKTLIGSVIIGISLLSSIEYAIASQIGLMMYFFSVLIIRRKGINKQWLQLFAVEGLIVTGFLIYLISNNAFQNFMRFHSEYLRTFYSEGPCREFFPRMDSLNKLNGNPIEMLSRLNYYFVPFFILATGIWLLFRKNIRFKTGFMVLIVYSLLVSYRTITSPCYYSYGMTFPILILSYLIFQSSISRWTRTIFVVIALWFIFTSTQFNLFTLVSEGSDKSIKHGEKELLPVAEIYLSKNFTKEYKAITSYIQAHTRPEEYIYTHRVGPYNQLAQRKSPVSVASSSVYEAAPFLVDLTLSELKQNPPSYVVINTYNGDSYSNQIRNIRYDVHIFGDKIIFEGDKTVVEDYISQNYMIDKVFNIAWILKRRASPIKLTPYYVPLNKPVQWSFGAKQLEQNIYPSDSLLEYQVTGKNPVIYFFAPEIKESEHLEVPIQINLGGIKPVSKFVISSVFITNTRQVIDSNDNIITSDWSNQWIYIPRPQLLAPGVEIVGVAMYVSDNLGFLPWGSPVSVKLNAPRLFIKNPQIGTTIKGYNRSH